MAKNVKGIVVSHEPCPCVPDGGNMSPAVICWPLGALMENTPPPIQEYEKMATPVTMSPLEVRRIGIYDVSMSDPLQRYGLNIHFDLASRSGIALVALQTLDALWPLKVLLAPCAPCSPVSPFGPCGPAGPCTSWILLSPCVIFSASA